MFNVFVSDPNVIAMFYAVPELRLSEKERLFNIVIDNVLLSTLNTSVLELILLDIDAEKTCSIFAILNSFYERRKNQMKRKKNLKFIYLSN